MAKPIYYNPHDDGYIQLSAYCAPGKVNADRFREACEAAIGKTLMVFPGTYIFPSEIVIEGSMRLFCQGQAIFQLDQGVIVNTDTDFDNYQSILQVRGCDWFVVEGIIFDGNRDNQVYPATVNTFGRGSRPFRHNALLEFVPSTDNQRKSENIKVTRCGFENAYMSGIALWQTGYALIENNDFRNNTWNGLAGCGMLDGLDFRNNRGYRNGVSPVYDVTRQTGDRATIQIREYDGQFTDVTEKIPTIDTDGLPQFSYGVNIIGNRMEEDQVEGIFVRCAFDVTIRGNRVVNCGYERLAGQPEYNGEVFFPGSIWFEWGTARIVDNDVIQTSPNVGWMKPDGIVVFSMEGDGIAPISMDGVYSTIVSGNRIACGQAFNTGAAYDANTEKRLNFLRGIRSNGNVLVQDNVIEGVEQAPILFLNDGNYNAAQIRKISITGNTVRNFTGEGAIHFQRFGSPTIVGGEIIVMGNRIYDGRCLVAGATRAMVLFDANLDGQQLDSINITGNVFDCLNLADSSLNYYGVRQRGASTCKTLNISNNVIKNAYRVVRLGGGSSISINDNVVDGCSRFIEFILTGNIGSLVINGNNVNGITFAIMDFTYSTATIARMVMANNLFQGTGNLGLENFDPAKHTVYVFQPNIVRMPNNIDFRRPVSGAPTVNAMYVGEILLRSDNSTCYIAKHVGTGATDWSLLA